ncbi:MAG: helix-turn-helix domain-containing protein [Desulfovibrionaceae bacterium]|nr:helix-turn-helix domain-containing protein [Desulfovibrionaceae bacterium]
MFFGKRLKSLLAQKHQSQIDFAQRLGITRSRLCNYINGRSEPDYTTLCKIADALSVSTDYLLGRNVIQESELQGNRAFVDFIPGSERPGNGSDAWIPLYRSRPDGSAPHSLPSGWLRDAGSSPQSGEFRQPYAILMEDDSMAPEIMPGDIAYIQPCFIYHPFMKQEAEKDLYGVRLDALDQVGTSLKRCHASSNILVFYSSNRNCSPVILDMNTILFVPMIGRVVSVWRSYLDSGLPRAIREADND